MTPLSITPPPARESEIALTQARAALGKMVDLERRVRLQGGGAQQLVHTSDGYLFQIPTALPYPQPAAEEWSPTQPQSSLTGLATPPQFLEARTRALMHRIEDAEAGMAAFGFPGDAGGFFRGVGLAAGVAPVHGFQPVWLGGSRWQVRGGTVTYPRLKPDEASWDPVTQSLAEVTLSIEQGWIAVLIQVAPDTHRHPEMTLTPYTVTAQGIIATGQLVNSQPARTVTTSGVNGHGDFESVTTWSLGTYMIPVAYVAAPRSDGNAAPRVSQIHHQISFLSPTWQGGLPNVL